MAARLKVFTWSDGFHRYTVAASSRAKALEVWGFHRDLFKTGDAQQIASGDDYQRALDHPGVSVERGLEIDPGKVALKTPKPREPKPLDAKPLGPSKRDLARVAAVEARIEALTRDHDAAAADLDRRRDILDADFAARSDALAQDLDAARRKLTLNS